ncbi:NAD(P)/FAD-dependent oxidoreductase [Rhodococcus sp. MEB064]|uniref:NAD(P)/FAD-dependent oxidoreductase n=1 Tax=Rhodococcus sp. MEB064 TaxID=1587522 RepID=UPI0005ACF2EF|nr:FAD-dependent oxidoreductase [Rhodococcus sp. MEB064]
MKRVVIVGASLAAVSAIEGLRDRDYSGEIHVIGAEDEPPYTRPPLSKEAMTDGRFAPGGLALREPEWYSERGVELHLGRTVTSLDTAGHEVLDDRGTSHSYDGLVIATGSAARELPAAMIAPEAMGDVFTLRTIADARRIGERLERGRRLIVVGGGFVGMEVAATAAKLGVDVTVVDVAPMPMSRVFGTTIGRWFNAMHRRHGVDVRCSTSVDRIFKSGDDVVVVLNGGERLTADTVLVGIGGVPAVDWLAGSGVTVDNGVVCDPDLQTSVPGIVAAGDVASWRNDTFGDVMRVEHWTNAVEQGRHAAGRLLGDTANFTSVPYFWTDQFEAKLRFCGRADADDEIVIESQDDTSLVALFGRAGKLRGVVCVNAPRKLAHYRSAIGDPQFWTDVVRNA